MVNFSAIAGLRRREPLDPPFIDVATQQLSDDLDPIVCPTFATTGARDIAYAAAISAGRVGMRCFITGRMGFSFYSGNTRGWLWEPQRTTLYDGRRPSAAAAAGVSPIPILLMPDVALPPGQRRIQITASSVARNGTGGFASPITPRIYPAGPVLPDGERWAQAYLPASDSQCTLANTWYLLASGTVSWSLYGLDGSGAGVATFEASRLQVFDLGPADT